MFSLQVLTKDSVTVSVDAVVYYRVSNATISVANVENAHHSTRCHSAHLYLLLTRVLLQITGSDYSEEYPGY